VHTLQPKTAFRLLLAGAALVALIGAIAAYVEWGDGSSGTGGTASAAMNGSALPAGGSVQPSSAQETPPPMSRAVRTSAAAPPVVTGVSPQAGALEGGNEVVIRGEHFEGRPQVLFGDNVARLVTATGGELSVVAPPGQPGAVTVVVTNRDGTYTVARSAYTYR
jgi:hypothetical protein